jgi:simple sugar transport system ATP-binding protein
MGGPLLSLDRLDKHFGAVHAVDAVSLAFEAGQVHAVVGENGAGKSTLLRMAAGIVVQDSGTVRVDAAVLPPGRPREAIRRGIGMVQQHFALAPSLTALENAVLGAELVRWGGVLDMRAARARAAATAAQMGVALEWDAPAGTMGVGDRQRLEIVRTLMRDARVLILDEPTAVLTPGEADALYATLRRLAEGGRAVVVVTHRLDEVRRFADVASVLRRGALVSTRTVRDARDEELAQLTRDIMGHDPLPRLERSARPLAEVRLWMRDVRLGRALRGVTLEVRAGEIVGVAGVEGNGQGELVRILGGLGAPLGGEVRGADGEPWSSEDVAVVYEDRLADGLVPPASVRENLVLGELGRFSRHGLVDAAALDREARARAERAQLAPESLALPASALSGGNQQRIVVARAVSRGERAAVLVFAQPTRGVDLQAARAIHTEIVDAASRGKAVLVVSADLAELRVLCDRILVIARGRIVADLPPDAPDARFGEAMLGGRAGAPVVEAPA